MTLCSLTKSLFTKTVIWAGITAYSLIGSADAAVTKTFACTISASPDIAYHVLEWKKDDGAWNQTRFSSCNATDCMLSMNLDEASTYTMQAFAVSTSNVRGLNSNKLILYNGEVLTEDRNEAVLPVPPEEFLAGNTSLVAGDAVSITDGRVVMDPALSSWDYGIFKIPVKVSRGVIDLKYEVDKNTDIKVWLKDVSGLRQPYHLLLKAGEGRAVVPTGFPFSVVQGFDLDALVDMVELEVPSSVTGLRINYLDVRTAGVFGSGRLQTVYADVMFIDNRSSSVADPSLVTNEEKVPLGLAMYLKFDSLQNIFVDELDSHDAFNNGGKWVSDGRHGGAVSFNRDGHMVVPDFESLFSGSYLPMTIATRLKKPGNNDTNVFIDTSYDTMRTERRDGFALVSSGNNNLKIAFEKDGVWTSIDTGVTLSNEMRTAVISIDATGNYFATQDGVMKNKGFLSSSIRFSPSHDSLWIGKKGDSTATAAATMEDLVIFNTGLTPLEASKISARLGNSVDIREEGGSDRLMSDLFVSLKRGESRLPEGMLVYVPFSDDSLSDLAGSLIVGTGGTWIPVGDKGAMQFSRDGTLKVMDFGSLFMDDYSPLTFAAVLSKPGYNDMNVILDTSYDTFSTVTKGGWSLLNSGTNNLIFGYEKDGAWAKIDSLCTLLKTPKAYVFSVDGGIFQSMMNGAIKKTASLGSDVPFNTMYDSLWIGGKGNGTVGYEGTISELGIFGALSETQKVEIADLALGKGYLAEGMPPGFSQYGEYSSGSAARTLDLSQASKLEVSFNMNDLQITRLGNGGSIDVVAFDSLDITKFARFSIPKSSISVGYNEFSYDVLNPTEVSGGFAFGSSKNIKVVVSQDVTYALDNPSYKKLDNLLIEFR